jgi:VWFA-related protein
MSLDRCRPLSVFPASLSLRICLQERQVFRFVTPAAKILAVFLPSWIAAICLLAAPAPVSAQDPSASQNISSLHVNTTLVVEDVTVVDAHGNPVHGLDQSQFTVLEDGKPQHLSHFEEHATLPAAEVAKLPPMPKLDPGVFTNYTTVPELGPVNVILLDSLNTPLQSQAYVHAQLRAFVNTMKPGSRVAIFAMSRELHLLQGFTSNPEILKAVLNGKKGTMQASQLLDNSVAGDLGPDSTLSDLYADGGGNDPAFTQALAQIQQFEAEQQSFELQMRAQYTLDALNQLARYLSGLPGRKNLIWFSGSFPIDILPDGDLDDPFAAMGDSEDEFRETVTLMARSHVAVFPVDARGLMVNGNLNAELSGAKYAANPAQFTKDTSSFFNQTDSEHSTMLQMAEKTGGKAFINTNGLKDAVDQAIDFGSNYYSLSYNPARHNWDGNFHSISIKLNDPKLKLSYRIGYYADDPDGPPNKAARPIFGAISATSAVDPTEKARVKQMRAAMQFGAPQPTQIVMKVKVTAAGPGHEDKLADGNVADPRTKGPYRRYAIDYAANARHVQFVPNPDGTFKATVEFAVLVYDDQGVLINSLSRTAVANVDEQKKEIILKTGMHMHQEISVPIKGHYWLRAGVHDRIGDSMGAVELNLDNVNRIATAATTAPLAK